MLNFFAINIGDLRGTGPLGLEGKDPSNAPGIFNRLMSTILGVMTIIAFLWFIIQFFVGVIAIIGSGGDKGKLEEAKKKLTNAIIGLVVIILATVLIGVIGQVLGINILGGVLNISSLNQ